MGIFTRPAKTGPSMVDTLAEKAADRDATSEDKHQEASDLAALAAQARQEAEEAARHAEALNRAADILADAGVTL